MRAPNSEDNVVQRLNLKKGWFVRATAAEAAAVTAEQGRRHGPSRLLLFLLLLTLLASLALWLVPQLQVSAARERLSAEAQLLPGERLVLENGLFEAKCGPLDARADPGRGWFAAWPGHRLATLRDQSRPADPQGRRPARL